MNQRVLSRVEVERVLVRFSIADFSECWKSEAKAAHSSYCGVWSVKWDVERLVVGRGPIPKG